MLQRVARYYIETFHTGSSLYARAISAPQQPAPDDDDDDDDNDDDALLTHTHTHTSVAL